MSCVKWTKRGWRDTEMAVWVFSPSASWSQLPPVWKPCLYWDPSQENSTSNKHRDKNSFNFNKQTNKQNYPPCPNLIYVLGLMMKALWEEAGLASGLDSDYLVWSDIVGKQGVSAGLATVF